MSQNKVKTRATETEENIEERMANLYLTDKWSRTVIQPLLITLLFTGFFTAIGITIDVLISTHVFVRLWPLFFLAAIEGVYTTLWLNRPRQRQLNTSYYRAAEFLVLALILRVYTFVVSGNYPDPALFADYLRMPWLLFNDVYFIVSLLLFLFTWVRAIALSRIFNEIAVDGAEAYYYSLSEREQDPGMKPAFSNRQQFVESLFQEWIVGGVILAVCTAIIAIDPPTFSFQDNILNLGKFNLPGSMITTMLIYFVGGLLLLSQAKFGSLNARWLHEGVIKEPNVERRWHRTTTWLILIIGLIALFLPIGSTFAIGRVLQAIFVGGMALFTFFSYLFITLLSLFFAPISDQLALTPSEIEPTAIPATPVPTAVPPPPPTPDDTAQILFSSAFWAVAIVMTVVALSFFFRDRGLHLNRQLFTGIGHGLLNWFRSIWQDVTEYADDVRLSVKTRLQSKPSDKTDSASPWRFIRLNSLSPRDQIRYFYLSTVKRAGDRGVKRQGGDTPLEYADELKEKMPEAEAEIEQLTQAFLQARYSRANIEKNDVSPVKKQWKQLKSNLRKRLK